ncbi:sensor domain-containing diguanylate cyclase, partial [Deinococcus pimensis]|uniref:sensor domain-containing diguanylate cyclase n=1 Tax=Deinococcus pimensis TaxID=309888 RepID=UPI00146FBFDF
MSRPDQPAPTDEQVTPPGGAASDTAYERRRLEVLRSYGVLDTPPEDAFDRVTRLAARMFGVPFALVSLVDERRQWHKSCYGWTERELSHDVSFCRHAVVPDFHEDVLDVPDTTLDERFTHNPLVTDAPGVRSYAGAPLVTQDGVKLGTLCIGDVTPRAPLTEEDRRALVDLARVVLDELELRRRNVELEGRVRDRMGELERLAFTDALTGLGNRRALDAALDAVGARAAGPDVHLVMLDIDELKAVNDRDGHARGDDLIRAVARALHDTFASYGRAYRLGGDEFVVLMDSPYDERRVRDPGSSEGPSPREGRATSTHKAEGPDRSGPYDGGSGRGLPDEAHVRDLVFQALERARAGGFDRVSASVGVAHLPGEARAPNDLLRLANERMLRQKAQRRAARRLANLAGGRELTAGAASETVRRAVYSTLALLASDRDLDASGWTALLEAAVAAVPGAETGSLYVRRGGDFVLRAQVGFSDALVGLSQPDEASRAWYGAQDDWEAGRARVISGAEVARRSNLVDESSGLLENREVYARHGELGQIRSNLCVPVVLHA